MLPWLPLADPASSLLVEFDGDAYVGHTLSDSFGSGMDSGPMSEVLRGQLETVNQWRSDPEPAVRRWADHLYQDLESQLPSRQQWDEKRGLL